MPGTPGEREESLDVIQRELTAFARRARATAAHLHPELPLVSYTLLAHIDEQQGCRATDLAAHYMLDKSTVSRQVSGLEKLGLVERHPDPADHRIQVLHPTESGTRALASTQARRRGAFQDRLAEWTAEDLGRFATYLLRYNSTSDTSPPEPPAP
ncbi:MarR family winged helix-turn-helix transcriptional regulator [Streptomyces sp. RKAG290]|uniref:MarR family winged helix-turn-helix transcriptional regulator n=1 Tax=Streptomyces sp. RKAG290 TaxID=2888348 RepID=UPI00203418AD|nr:MarR family winged helix-turn-helix transcriptional regulator [Streptomyces sp. RKAG290]MCM2412973.1 MarR family winged helix-turn-helix transcriptional regulator [Streptomyces sp. RKAG290]